MSVIPLDRAEHAGGSYVPAYRKSLRILPIDEFLTIDLPPRRLLLGPWLPEKGLTMVHAERGIGKTWFALNVAVAVASGGTFLSFAAPDPKRVVYIDGEMPAPLLQERLSGILTAAGREFDRKNLQIVAADMQPDGLPDLADPDHQRFYDHVIADANLTIVDNLSTVCRGLKENDADSYGALQSWELAQRAAGRSVLLVHHANKSGGQRGSSKKEDILDSVIQLRRPPDYDAAQGSRFEVHFTKARSFHGADSEPFEAWLTDGNWSTGPISHADDLEAARTLKAQGHSLRDIAHRTGISKSTVWRALKEETR